MCRAHGGDKQLVLKGYRARLIGANKQSLLSNKRVRQMVVAKCVCLLCIVFCMHNFKCIICTLVYNSVQYVSYL